MMNPAGIAPSMTTARVPDAPMNAFENINDSLRVSIDRLNIAISRISRLADQCYGPVPEAPQSNSIQAVSSTTTDHLRELDFNLNSLFNAINRLDSR